MSTEAIRVQKSDKTLREVSRRRRSEFHCRSAGRSSVFSVQTARESRPPSECSADCLNPLQGPRSWADLTFARRLELVKRHIGYMSQRFSLYDDLTVEQNIAFYGGIYGLSPEQLQRRTTWVLQMADLKGREKTLTKTLAGGWKQRLALGCAVLHEPPIVFLDEPTGGVDPISRRAFWDLINRLSAEGVTVLVTTHFLDEAEYCNDIVLINAGKLIASGSPTELKTNYIRYPMLEVGVAQGGIVDALEIDPRSAMVDRDIGVWHFSSRHGEG